MASLDLVVLENNARKKKSSSATTVDFLSVKIGPSGLELKETSGAFDVSAKKITNLATPTANSDAATKQYVDQNVGGGGITAGMYASYSLTGYGILSAPGTIETLFDTQIEDPSNLYNPSNGRITIPSGYPGTARVNVKATILLNTANQSGWVLWHLRKGGVFQKYGKGIRLDNSAGMDLSFDCDFEFSGTANEYFNITYYCSSNLQIATGYLDIKIYPK